MKLVFTTVFLNLLLISVTQSKSFLVETDEEGGNEMDYHGHDGYNGRPDHFPPPIYGDYGVAGRPRKHHPPPTHG